MNHPSLTSKRNIKKRVSGRMKRAKFIAETSTHRRRIAPLKRELENKLMKGILVQSFALQILRNSDVPTPQLLREFRDVELQSGQFLNKAFEIMQKEPRSIDLQGILSGTLSLLPLGRPPIPDAAKPFVASLKQKTVRFLLRHLDDTNTEPAGSKKIKKSKETDATTIKKQKR